MKIKRSTTTSRIIWLFVVGMLLFLFCVVARGLTNKHTAVKTPYCTLHYSTQWEEYLVTEKKNDPVVVSYFSHLKNRENQHLFDIGFNSGSGDWAGSLQTEKGDVVKVYTTVGVLSMDDTWSQEEKQIVLAMRDELDTILRELNLTPPEVEFLEEYDAVLEEDPVIEYEDLITNTPYGELRYPGEWADLVTVTVEQKEEVVVTYYATTDWQESIPLFDLCFTENLENSIGVLQPDMRVGVSVIFHPLDEVSAEYYGTMEHMQEAVNYILENLPITNLPDQEESESQPPRETDPEYGDVEIDTPYAKLIYSERWKGYLRTNVVNSDIYTVEFFGKVNAQPEQLLFSILFGVAEDADDFAIMPEQQKNGVGIIMGDIKFDNTWSEDEKNTFYAMQEEVNYIIENIVFKQ